MNEIKAVFNGEPADLLEKCVCVCVCVCELNLKEFVTTRARRFCVFCSLSTFLFYLLVKATADKRTSCHFGHVLSK